MWRLSIAMRHLALGLALAGWLFASLANAADPVTPPGSRISLEPPKGFVVATTFTGFLDQPTMRRSCWRNSLRSRSHSSVTASRRMRWPSTACACVSQETIEGLPYEQIAARAEQRVGNQIIDKWLMVINSPDVVGMVTVSVAKPAPPTAVGCRDPRRAGQRTDQCGGLRSIRSPPCHSRFEPTARFTYRKPLSGRGLLLKETPPPPEGQLDDVGFIVSSRRRYNHCFS